MGDYVKNPDLINGMVHYTSKFDEGKYGIWFCKCGYWVVGKSENLGKGKGSLINDTPDECPYHMEYDWKYFIPEYKTWTKANEGFSIWCKN